MKLRGAYLTMHRRFNQHFRSRFDVTADQFVVLMLLSEEDGITQLELTHRSYSDSSTTAALLRLLERKGYVSRETNPLDRRERLVRLTLEGRRMQQKLLESSHDLHSGLQSSAKSPADARVLDGALANVADLMVRQQ